MSVLKFGLKKKQKKKTKDVERFSTSGVQNAP